jgi:hypothetical protein
MTDIQGGRCDSCAKRRKTRSFSVAVVRVTAGRIDLCRECERSIIYRLQQVVEQGGDMFDHHRYFSSAFDDTSTRHARAASWLEALLREGALPAEFVRGMSPEAGITYSTMEAARQGLHVVTEWHTRGSPHVWWRLYNEDVDGLRKDLGELVDNWNRYREMRGAEPKRSTWNQYEEVKRRLSDD